MSNSIPSEIKVKSDVISMLYGFGFKELLIREDKTNFFSDENIIDIGYYNSISTMPSRINNKNILYTLQNVDMESNIEYYKVVRNLILTNKHVFETRGYKLFIKNHPRYNRTEKLIFDEELPFITYIDDDLTINDIINDISLHITSKSTVAFDLALKGIPTIFIDLLEVRSPHEMFVNQFKYPIPYFVINNTKNLKDNLLKLENEEFYCKACSEVYEWSKLYYQNFDNDKFLKLLT
jgi:hypothetical protein